MKETAKYQSAKGHSSYCHSARCHSDNYHSAKFQYTKFFLLNGHLLNVIGLHHPLDGITNLEYKLMCLIQLTIFFVKRRSQLAFNRDRCCHLALRLQLILFHSTKCLWPSVIQLSFILSNAVAPRQILLALVFFEKVGYRVKTFLRQRNKKESFFVLDPNFSSIVSIKNLFSRQSNKEGSSIFSHKLFLSFVYCQFPGGDTMPSPQGLMHKLCH